MIVAIPRHSLLLCAVRHGCCYVAWCFSGPSKTSRTITSQAESSKPPGAKLQLLTLLRYYMCGGGLLYRDRRWSHLIVYYPWSEAEKELNTWLWHLNDNKRLFVGTSKYHCIPGILWFLGSKRKCLQFPQKKMCIQLYSNSQPAFQILKVRSNQVHWTTMLKLMDHD